MEGTIAWATVLNTVPTPSSVAHCHGSSILHLYRYNHLLAGTFLAIQYVQPHVSCTNATEGWCKFLVFNCFLFFVSSSNQM